MNGSYVNDLLLRGVSKATPRQANNAGHNQYGANRFTHVVPPQNMPVVKVHFLTVVARYG